MSNQADDKLTKSEGIIVTPEAEQILAGITEKYLDDKAHYTVEVRLESSTGPSTLMIPDVTGGEPVFITRSIDIKGKKLAEFFEKKEIGLPEALKDVIADATISCKAFYYSKTAMLYAFEIKFDKGLIKALTKDDSLDALFDVKGASLRVIKCPQASYDVLQKYVSGLAGHAA